MIRGGGRDPLHVDVRIVTATHRDLDEAAADGNFREDLLYRLACRSDSHPAAARARSDDMHDTLAQHFVRSAMLAGARE